MYNFYEKVKLKKVLVLIFFSKWLNISTFRLWISEILIFNYKCIEIYNQEYLKQKIKLNSKNLYKSNFIKA